MKGSELRRSAEQIELRNLVNEFAERLEVDPYQPGILHPNLGVDDLQEVAEDLLFIRDFNEVELKVVKGADGFSIAVEVIKRSK